MFNIFSRFFCNFNNDNNKFRKYGFSLAEALIVTVMTGACLLPILGTMQNAQVRTEAFDHQSKMQQYARSRLTAEIANAAFDHKSINLEDEYHYIAYFNKDGNEEDAKLTEFPKTFVTPEEIASLSNLELKDEWSDASKDFLGIDTDSEHYFKLVHAYKTTVETQYDIKLATYTPGVINEDEDEDEYDSFSSPKGLLAIVVKTCLLESNEREYYEEDGCLKIDPPIVKADGVTINKDEDERVTPVTLFSFANLPVVSDEYIWLADSHNKRVIGIDPEGKTVATEFDFSKEGEPSKPLHIAVHPSGKLLAIQSKKIIYLANIDIKSSCKGEKKVLVSSTDDYATEDEGGIAFRTDGKVLYFTDKHNKKLHIYGFDCEFNSNNTIKWNNTTPTTLVTKHADIDFSAHGDKFSNLVAANDGNLYVAEDDTKKIFKYPMYSPFEDGKSYKTKKLYIPDKKTKSIDVSNDGKYLLYVPKEHSGDKSIAKIYETQTGNEVKSFECAKELSYGVFSTFSNKDFSFKDNSLFATFTVKKKTGTNAVVQIFALDDKVWKDLQNTNIDETGKIIQSPIDGKIIFSSKIKNTPEGGPAKNKEKANLYFSNFLYDLAAHDLTDEESMVFSEDKGVSGIHTDFAAGKHDVMAVAKNDKNIDLYNLNTLKKLEDKEIVDNANSITSLSMNPQGDQLIACHGTKNANGTGGGASSFSIFRLNDSSKITEGSGFGKKAVFDDRTPNMAFTLKYPNGLGEDKDAFWNVNTAGSYYDDWDSDDSYSRKFLNLHSDWERLDMIGMPNGGVMALYGKPDGSSMIEWIGRRNWLQDSDKGKYRLFSRWTNIKSDSGASGGFWTFPDYSLNSCTGNLDSWEGRVAIMKDIALPVNGKVVSLNVIVGDFTGTRAITPLLLEKQSGSTDFKVKAMAQSIGFSSSGLRTNVPIIWWANGGIIENSDYRLGFYSGSWFPDHAYWSISAGSVVFATSPSNYTYLADYYLDGTSYSDSNKIQPNAFITTASPFKINEVILKEYPNAVNDEISRARNYALSFNIEVADVGSEFPPLGAKKLAITPNESMLAILATNTSDVPIVNLYDFNNQIYGPETQIEGLLVDYRIPFDSGAWDKLIKKIIPAAYNWPEESVDFFKEVQTNCGFTKRSGDTVSLSLKNATTKNDSWKIFNRYPANYYVSGEHPDDEPNISKEIASKRYFGYFRPFFDVNYMQTYGSEDIRFFLNKNFIGGRTDVPGGSTPFDPDMNFRVKENEIALFQKDEASNIGGMRAQIFIASVAANLVDVATFTKVASASIALESYYKITDGYEDLFDYIRSEQTQILNNHPTFMMSFEAKTGSTKLNTEKTSMVFSRDKAKPVLYIAGTTYLWALYNNIIRFNSSIGFTTNLAISTDGQKLIYGDNKNTLRIHNIASPDESLFTSSGQVKNIQGSGQYIEQIASIAIDVKPIFLATKPYNSFSSSPTDGYCKEMLVSSVFSISTNAVAVASGGIYIVSSDSQKIALYNPLVDKSNIMILSDELKRNANSAAVAAYDDTIYLFGNAGQTGDALNGRVQSYNVNSKVAMTSLKESGGMPSSGYDDEYQISYGIPNSGNDSFPSNFGITAFSSSIDISSYIKGSNVVNPFHAFVNNQCDYALAESSSSYIELNYSCPLTINCIRFGNNGDSLGAASRDRVRVAELVGSNSGSSESTLHTLSNIPNSGYFPDLIEYSGFNTTNTPFAKYKLYFKKAGDYLTGDIGSLNKGVVNLVQLIRKGVKRLTPPIGCFPNTTEYYHNNDTQYLSWTNYETGLRSTIKWSSHASNTGIIDLWVTGREILDNNLLTKDVETWQPVATDSLPYLFVTLSKEEALCAVRYSNHNRDDKYLKKFKVYGSNYDAKLPGQTGWESDWDNLKFTTGNYEFVGPQIKQTFITAELNNNKKYSKYLFLVTESENRLALGGFEMFAKPVSGPEEPTQDYMTPLKNDNLEEVKTTYSAACATPYGLAITGGRNTNVCNHAMLYWPHAINKYDGSFTQFGIPRSLPDLSEARMQHALVWHKGKIYAIGGKGASEVCAGDSFAEYLDYNNSSMTWQQIDKDSVKPDGNDTVESLKRFNHGACSFGNEIFIFGGQSTSARLKTAYAWNPDTSVVRRLTDLGQGLSPCCAVPFGSKIYVIGMSSDTEMRIYEYTP